jgi:hypothetical protein
MGFGVDFGQADHFAIEARITCKDFVYRRPPPGHLGDEAHWDSRPSDERRPAHDLRVGDDQGVGLFAID